jgi:AraC family transcriptional regulator
MKSSTRNSHARRIEAVTRLLQQAIADGRDMPSLAELAAQAHLSAYHFHRIWRALTGETVGATVSRLRLLRALHLLADPGASVGATALAVGYETPQAFARAFHDALGASPSSLRGRAGPLADARERLANAPAVEETMAALQVDVRSIEPFEVVVLRKRGAFDGLDQAYQRLVDWAVEAGVAEDIAGLYGVPLGDHRDLPPEELEFDCVLQLAAASPTPPAPLERRFLGGGEYACASHVGSYAQLEAVTDWMLARWLPDHGREARDAPVHYHFLDDPETVPEALLRAAVCVPLRGG